jgi:hypothetical protein
MQLSDDLSGRNLLIHTVIQYYRSNGARPVRKFSETEDKEWAHFYAHFLVDRKYVIRYGIGADRGDLRGGVELAIGPHYFGPADFWSYENSERFTLEASTEGIERNLALLDEFWRTQPT